MSLATEITKNSQLLDELSQIIWNASEAIMTVYRSDDFGESTKCDDLRSRKPISQHITC